MKKTQKAIILLFTITIILTIYSTNSLAWDDCPFGLEDEPYPGSCWRYVDENSDGICDHSQSEPPDETNNEDTLSGTKLQNQKGSTKFPIMLIFSLVIILTVFLILRMLVNKKILTNAKEKIIWNILLLIFFIPSAITGVLLLLMSNMDFLRELGQSFTQIHDISSLFFMWISGYHIIWHTKYYVKGIRNLVTKK